ncbi:MAG: hypothetical protein D3904_14325 [Candidatus Electrothrix sp. EH2]|nr:hypothetical protein [Candidatus Electrothrix sp. EH2]
MGQFGAGFAGQREKRAYFEKKFGKLLLNQMVDKDFQNLNIALNLRHYRAKPTRCSTSRKTGSKWCSGGEVLQKGIDRELNLRV